MKAGPRLLHSHRTAGRIVRARLLDGLGSRRELPASKGLMPPRIPGGKVCPYEFLEPKASLPLPAAPRLKGDPGPHGSGSISRTLSHLMSHETSSNRKKAQGPAHVMSCIGL